MYPIIQLVIEGSCKQQFCTEELETEWQILLFHKNYTHISVVTALAALWSLV